MKKSLVHLPQHKQDELELIKDIILEKIPDVRMIVLFGSYARGEDAERSDIDLLIVSYREATDALRIFLSKAEKELERPVSLHVFPSLEESPAAFRNATANGIVLNGYVTLAWDSPTRSGSGK